MRRGALRSALTDALESGKLAVVDELDWAEPKTKQAVGVLDSLGLAGRVLVVLPAPSEAGTVEKSFQNLPNVKIAYSGGLGTYDVLLADRVLFTAAALDGLTRRPGETPEDTPEDTPEETPTPRKKSPTGSEEVAG
jgi:large subunit ribosomal protein L4